MCDEENILGEMMEVTNKETKCIFHSEFDELKKAHENEFFVF